MIKRFAMSAGLLLMLALPLVAFSGTALADPVGTNQVVQECQYAIANGIAEEFFGQPVTVGQCVNILRGYFGPAPSAQSNNWIAGLCSLSGVQQDLGVTNQGQCIQAISADLGS